MTLFYITIRCQGRGFLYEQKAGTVDVAVKRALESWRRDQQRAPRGWRNVNIDVRR